MNGLAKSVALGVVTVATVGQAKTTTTKLKTSLKESFHEMKKGAIGDLSKDLVDQVVHNGKKILSNYSHDTIYSIKNLNFAL